MRHEAGYGLALQYSDHDFELPCYSSTNLPVHILLSWTSMCKNAQCIDISCVLSIDLATSLGFWVSPKLWGPLKMYYVNGQGVPKIRGPHIPMTPVQSGLSRGRAADQYSSCDGPDRPPRNPTTSFLTAIIRYWSWNYRGCWNQTCPLVKGFTLYSFQLPD